MKRIGISAFFIFTTFFLQAQKSTTTASNPIRAKVDPRIELLSVMAKLAGVGGYESKALKFYVDDVYKHFGKDSLHPAILHLKKLSKESALAYDAVMRMAMHLHYPSLTPKVKFTSSIPADRWTKEGAEKFVPLVQQFYKDTHFDSFFRAHKSMYEEAEKRFQVLLDQIDYDWYPRFYGYKPEGGFYVYLGLLIGRLNYGFKVEYPSRKEEIYAIMSNYQADAQGLPLYDAEVVLPTIIHEFNHSFIDHLILNDSVSIKQYGEKIHEPFRLEMQRNFYTQWTQTTYESLVRAAVIRYQIEHDTTGKEAVAEAAQQYKQGFLWIQDLVALMGIYENSRNQYKTFAAFMPLIKSYFKDLATNMHYTYRKYRENFPKVVTSYPFVTGADNVDPSTREMTIVFDRPMNYGWSWRANEKDTKAEHFPLNGAAKWDETYTKLTLQFRNLKPDWEYEFWLTPDGFRTREGHPLDMTIIKFKTE
jgi:hypothetical protein